MPANSSGSNIKSAFISSLSSVKRLEVFLLPLEKIPVHRWVTPKLSIGTHLYTWVERGTVRVKCLAQEHNNILDQGSNPTKGPLINTLLTKYLSLFLKEHTFVFFLSSLLDHTPRA